MFYSFFTHLNSVEMLASIFTILLLILNAKDYFYPELAIVTAAEKDIHANRIITSLESINTPNYSIFKAKECHF